MKVWHNYDGFGWIEDYEKDLNDWLENGFNEAYDWLLKAGHIVSLKD